MAPIHGSSSASGQSLLYLLETSSVALLADRLKSLSRSLENISAAPPVPWRVDLALKTIHVAVPGVQRTVTKPQSTGENLYVVKTTEHAGCCYMLATKQKSLQSSGAATKRKVTVYGDLVETGTLGEEVMTLVKGYQNRLTMTIEGSSYTVADTVKASIGFFTRGNTLTSIALKVRYDVSGATPEEAQRVLKQFVSGLVAAVGDDVKPRLVQAQPELRKGQQSGGLVDYIQLFLG